MTSETSGPVERPRPLPAAGRAGEAASRPLAIASGAAKNDWLLRSARSIRDRADEILAANARMSQQPPVRAQSRRDRPADPDPAAARSHRARLRDVAALPDPIGEVITSSRAQRPRGHPDARPARRHLHDLREPP